MSQLINMKWAINSYGSVTQDPKVVAEFFDRIQIITGTKKDIFLAAQTRIWKDAIRDSIASTLAQREGDL